MFSSKYSHEPLAEVIRSCVPHLRLGQVSTPLLITSSDISAGGVHVFKSGYLKKLGERYVRDGPVLLADAILASCAAPTYFDPAQVGESLLADGGLWANNPSIIALAACPRNTGVEWSGGIIGVVQQRGAGDEQELPSL